MDKYKPTGLQKSNLFFPCEGSVLQCRTYNPNELYSVKVRAATHHVFIANVFTHLKVASTLVTFALFTTANVTDTPMEPGTVTADITTIVCLSHLSKFLLLSFLIFALYYFIVLNHFRYFQHVFCFQFLSFPSTESISSKIFFNPFTTASSNKNLPKPVGALFSSLPISLHKS